MFFNEEKLLNLKMSEEFSHIDQMIIVEATKTHSNKPRQPLLRYRPPNDNRVKVVTVGEKFTNNSRHNEASQRNAALDIINLKDDDILICCDMDEIVPEHDVPLIIEKVKEHGFIRIKMEMYYYKINLRVGGWSEPFAINGKRLKEMNHTLTQLRHKRKGSAVPVSINTNGKHFSYLMDAEGIQQKLKSFLHTELDKPRFTNLDHIRSCIKNQQDLFGRNKKSEVVPLDSSYPKTILNNLGEWEEYII